MEALLSLSNAWYCAAQITCLGGIIILNNECFFSWEETMEFNGISQNPFVPLPPRRVPGLGCCCASGPTDTLKCASASECTCAVI